MENEKKHMIEVKHLSKFFGKNEILKDINFTESAAVTCCYCLVTKLYLTLPPHGLQHARLPCPSLSPRVCSNSCPLSW